MKHILINLFCCIVFFSLFAFQSQAIEIPSTIAETEDPIFLEGLLQTGDLRSGGDVITAELQDGVIMALFHKDVGSLLVTITDEAHGTVYETTVNTSVQQQLLIPLSGVPFGTYTITLSNERGEMRGEFEI